MAHPLYQIAQTLCLALPESEEFVSHGAPNFRVKKGKIFACYTQNHHGDGRVALWLNSPPGAQAAWTDHDLSADTPYFVPPYLGPRGWLGVRLDRQLAWSHVYDLICEAYRNTAHPKWHAMITSMPTIDVPPDFQAADVDPMQSLIVQKHLKAIREICSTLPETSEVLQYGNPVWRAGKRTFLQLHVNEGKLSLVFWADGETQSMLLDDPRHYVPPFLGHRGWIALDLNIGASAEEVKARIFDSYRHFALKRMLSLLSA